MTKILIEIDTDTQRVVPVDPDNEMITAGIVAHAAHDFLRVDHIYRDMIAAAPQPEPVDAIANFIQQFKRHIGGDGEFWLHELEDFYDAT